jgi:N-acetylmuramoyl-L-alanine amidase
VQVAFRREPLSGKKVVLDAGHGGRDSGARGTRLLEKDVTLDVAQRTARLLCTYGAVARLTRSTDQFVDLFARAELANSYDADLFVSVHCNAMPRRNQGHGTETFYCRPDSKCLGYLVQGCLVDALQRSDRGLKQARFVVIRETNMPAVLAELMFINDDREETLLAQNAVRDKAAGALAEGVRRYFEGSGSAPFAPGRSVQVTGAG